MLATHPAGLSYLTYGLSSNALAIAEWLIIPNSYFPDCMAGHSVVSSWLKTVSVIELISGLTMLALILAVGAVKGLRLLGDSPLLTKLKTL